MIENAEDEQEYPTHDHPDDPVIHTTPKLSKPEDNPARPAEMRLALMKNAAKILGRFNYPFFKNLIQINKPHQFDGEMGKLAFPKHACQPGGLTWSAITTEDVQEFVTAAVLSSLEQYFKLSANSYTNECYPCLSIHIEPNSISVNINLYSIEEKTPA